MIFFFNDTATTEIYTLSLHDALPIFRDAGQGGVPPPPTRALALEHPADDSRPSVIASSDGTCSSAAAPGIASAANAGRTPANTRDRFMTAPSCGGGGGGAAARATTTP